MIGHLGSRVSALLDGQLTAAEEERAWAHVHVCPPCRDLVEREGWVKTRLAGLSLDSGTAPAHLKGTLVQPAGWSVTGDWSLGPGNATRSRVALGVIGGGALASAVVTVLVLSGPAAQAPVTERRPTVTSLTVPGRPQPSGAADSEGQQRRGGTLPTRRQGSEAR